MAARTPRALIIAKVAVQYFAIVFATGLILGAIRTLLVVPRLGVRSAELIETPLMLAVVFLSARWITHRSQLDTRRDWVAVGLFALALMLLVEFTVVLSLRDLSLGEYFATRDPVSGSVYFASLGVFAVCPWLVFRASLSRRLRGNGPAA
jgi:hypothetical protein